MRRPRFPVLLVLALLGGLLTAGLAAPAEAATSGQRAVWVWTRPAAKTLVAWAAKRHVGELFVSVAPGFSTTADRDWLASVVTRAHADGIRVAALGGDPGWIDDPAAATAWVQEVAASGLFDGVHVDVEPWVRSDWAGDQPAVVAAYLEVLVRLRAATTLPLEADVAFWLWQVPTADGTPLDQAVLATVDAITVMSYRNVATGPNSISDIGAHELASAAAAGKPCRLAVETNDLGPDPVSRSQTFYGSSTRTLTRALAEVDRAEAAAPAYAGVAVEDYAGWRSLG